MYVYPIRPDEIYHYGMPERSGRYAWGSGDRPYQRLEKKVSRMESKLNRRFSRGDAKIDKKQAIANKRYEQAIRRSNSWLSTKKSEEKAFDKATRAQRIVNKEIYNLSRLYERYSKTFDKLNVVMDSELQKKGLEYYNALVENSKMQYQTYLIKR